MQIVPSTFLALAVILLLLWRGPFRGLWLFLLLTPFGAAAAFNLPAVGGASIGVMDLAAVALFAIEFLTPDGIARLAGTMRAGQPGFYIMLLVAFAIISAVLLPRLFQGATDVFGLSRADNQTTIVLVPLRPTSGNFTQLFRILLDAMTFLALATVFRLRPDPRPVLTAMIVATAVHLALGAADVLTVNIGAQSVMDVIRTANYDMLVGNTMGGITRMIGGFPEASSFGYYTLGLFGFWLQYWIFGQRRGLALAMLAISGFLLIRSTSSSSYVAGFVFLLTFALISVTIGAQNKISRRGLSLAFSGGLIAWLALLAIFTAYQTIEPLTAFLDSASFDKADSSSGVERMRWNTHAWQSFLDTWLMGAGIGSVRASNWLLACPASIGLIGTSLFLGFLYTLARLPSISQTPKRDAVIRALKAGCLVGGVVVEHEMHVARLEDSAVDAAQKAQELPGPPLVVCGQTTAGQWVARQAFADDHARLHIECCEQRGRAVALVIVGHRLRPTFLEGKPWLGPVKCLNLRLFVNAKHDRSLWRIEVKSDDIGDFLLEHRVVRHLEPARQVRLETGFCPDAPHARRRNAHRLGHRGAAPVRGIGRGLLHRRGDHLQPGLPGQRRHPRGAGLVASEPGHALVKIARLPAPDGGLGRFCAPHDLVGATAICRRQHDLGSPDNLARRVSVGEQSLKLPTVGGVQIQTNVIASHVQTVTHLIKNGNPLSGGEH
jgi:hypothetical protein